MEKWIKKVAELIVLRFEMGQILSVFITMTVLATITWIITGVVTPLIIVIVVNQLLSLSIEFLYTINAKEQDEVEDDNPYSGDM